MSMIVTIDGPAGAGKSSAARKLAARLGFQFLDTGAMYRAVTWHCLDRGVDLHDEQAVADIARSIDLRLESDRVFVDDREVTREIRSTAVTHETRYIAGNTLVRLHLVTLQRQLAAGKNVVTEGRDQGTVAFPEAECKFYLTANAETRALRRQHDLATHGERVPLAEILEQQNSRDARDAIRKVGALKPAADAITIDTSNLKLDEAVSQLERIVRSRMGESGAG